MFKVMVPIAALFLYIPIFFGYVVSAIMVSMAVVFLGLVLFCLGLAINYRCPRLAALAIGGWTIAWIVVLAAVSAGAARLVVSIEDASPATANASVKTFAVIGAAALTAVLGWLLGGRFMLTGGGIAKRCLRKQYTTWFPSHPQAPEQGIVAWQEVSHAFFTAKPADWRPQFRSNLFRVVKAARDVNGYFGGSAWREAEPPRQNSDAAEQK
ncbi:hypothetical protein ABQF26_07990 [Mycolicibacterium elephantis]